MIDVDQFTLSQMEVYTYTLQEWLASLTDDERERFEERAAIKEFCGLLPRKQAERQAKQEIMNGRTAPKHERKNEFG